MFIGKKPFEMTDNGLNLTFRPKLHKKYFKDGKASFKLYGQKITYVNPLGLNTYDEKAVITDIEVINHEGSHWIKGSNIGLWHRTFA